MIHPHAEAATAVVEGRIPQTTDDSSQSGSGLAVTSGEHIPPSRQSADINDSPFLPMPEVDLMEPFLMTIVGDTDFWLFAGSNGGFTAGRMDADQALFPYRTADKILRQPGAAGALTVIECAGELWQPLADGPIKPAAVSRMLHKHHTGCAVRYEETHRDLDLRFSMTLVPCDEFGLVRECLLENTGTHPRAIRMLDGWHGILPPGVSEETHSKFSYLANAYMRHEWHAEPGVGVYTLNCGITDRAEPFESLRVAVAWSAGLERAGVYLTDRCLPAFAAGAMPEPRDEVRGEPGALLLAESLRLPAGAKHRWFTVADTGLDHEALARLKQRLASTDDHTALLDQVLPRAAAKLSRRIAGAGAFQHTAAPLACHHHFANVLFNSMRGGVPADGGRVDKDDFVRFLKSRSTTMAARHHDWLAALPDDPLDLETLSTASARRKCPQLRRLASEYLPLTFSRRHGDPSRPWNRFSIRLRDPDGRPVCSYSGNWRDIFQNWEGLAHSYPCCAPGMIAVFLNSSTADGYNPYRISREGIDWEVEDPKDPWSHIGYWGDHQIVYLHRLLRLHEDYLPGELAAALDERRHVYAIVPYEIRSFDRLIEDPRHSIRFNSALHDQLLARAALQGNDAKLIHGDDGSPLLVTLAEKLLVPLLVKLTNLVPGGGIWLNTQRPEWNDGNNALAGWGLSVVTVCHIHAYVRWLSDIFDTAPATHLTFSSPVAALLESLTQTLADMPGLDDDGARLKTMTLLGRAGERHREAIYRKAAMTGVAVPLDAVLRFLDLSRQATEATILHNRRDDGMFHSYNVLEIVDGRATVHRLQLMLEGQVAALASGLPDGQDAVRLLAGLRGSELYRPDQHSYLLQPDRPITPFEDRNRLPGDWEARVPLIATASPGAADALVRRAGDGGARFTAGLANERSLRETLRTLVSKGELPTAAAAEEEALANLWEDVFHHRSFIGRSGAMFAFEGLGSIYWHMVAKLLLAVQECHGREHRRNPDSPITRALADSYRDIRAGLGFSKSARQYGAFPTDPYSHSPRHLGAQQPGMTGQVKEEILTRMGELGVRVHRGRIHFDPALLDEAEFFSAPTLFRHPSPRDGCMEIPVPADALAFILLGVPVVYQKSTAAARSILFTHRDGRTTAVDGHILPPEICRSLFRRDGRVSRIDVSIPAPMLRNHSP